MVRMEDSEPEKIKESDKLGWAYQKFCEETQRNGLPSPDYAWGLLKEMGDTLYQDKEFLKKIDDGAGGRI